ncbi:hypothetical protein HK405_003030, partial [Cladochytrium tenue]
MITVPSTYPLPSATANAFNTVFKARGADVEIGARLAGMCKELGLHNVTEGIGLFPIGWNGPIGKLCAEDFKQANLGASRKVFQGDMEDAVFVKLVQDGFKQA